MKCPRCGATMNRHAEKPSDPRDAEETRASESGAGACEEIYTCPRCGAIESRRVLT